jgi:hypothetical protein
VWRWSPDGAYSAKSAYNMLKLVPSLSMVTSSCGRLGRRLESRSSFGWPCDAGTGRWIGELAMASRQETAAISVIKLLKQSITSSLHARSLGSSGTLLVFINLTLDSVVTFFSPTLLAILYQVVIPG